VRGFGDALTGEVLSVIAEIKRRSPSRGTLAADLDPVGRARAYEVGGASAVSILTEPDHFSGSDADLVAVRSNIGLPVLRKDFTLDPAQIWEARAIGADAILLIVGILSDADLARLNDTAMEAGVDVLVEVHSRPEAERALEISPRIVGVNNRDLTTFAVDLAVSEELSSLLADVPVTVGESGIFTPGDARRMRNAGYDAVLVGESLVKAGDPATTISRLRVP
jgi:indole-3-glycerol phosphate synthase